MWIFSAPGVKSRPVIVVHITGLIREMPTETVAAARKASSGQVLVSCSPGKNKQAIIQISNVFMRKATGG